MSKLSNIDLKRINAIFSLISNYSGIEKKDIPENLALSQKIEKTYLFLKKYEKIYKTTVIEYDYINKRIEEILGVVTSIAKLDYSKKAYIEGNGDIFDAIAGGINMLGEELKGSTVSLKEKETLLREIHHRVKNNLQVISSLLNLQTSFIEDTTAKEKFSESVQRVRSMALIHEMLYNSENLSQLNFSKYIESLSKYLFDTYVIKYGYIGYESSIKTNIKIQNIDTAITCGLIINELISNSLKYAFPNDRKGTLSVSVDQNDKSEIKIIVKDNGIGMSNTPVIEEISSFGFLLIHTLIEQLEGKIKLTTGQNKGTKTEIRFKI
jgi:two-component sensor histidine kinase